MDGFGSPSSLSALKARYPMYVIPVKKLMQMRKFLIHREMMERNLLQEYTPETEGRVIVVSHQWLSYNHPDPDQEHFFTLKRVLDRLGNGEVNRVEDYWLHAVMFRSTGITAREWKNEFENTFVWIDYCCIPQVEVDMDPRTVTLSGLAVQSISAYVERASLLLVLAPICVHKDSQQPCNFSSWRKRGWCRLEMMSALLSSRDVRVMICQGAEATPFLLHPFEAPRMPVGDGDFSCCELGHTMGGHTMACDKQRLRGVMEEMLQAKVASYKGEGKAAEKMWWACMQGFLLKGLPEKEVSFCIPEGMSLFPDEEEDVEKLHHFLRQRFNTNRGLEAMKRMIGWTDYDKKRADASGFTLMMCAAISDNADAVHELAVRDITGNLVNQGLKRHFYHLAFMWKNVKPLGAAMAYASWETVQALLDSGADPRAQAQNGMDAFFFACCLGNLENIKGWLKTFPTWNMDRTIPLLGLSALCAAVCSGIKKEPVLKALIEARANLTQKNRWGGESSLLCMVANNEDSQCEALNLLLDGGCDVNAKWTAHTSLFAGALKVVRMGSKVLPDRPLAELAVLQGSTPLHFAAKRGDVEMVRLLISSKADVHQRNAEGRRPIDVARGFFGGQVPQPLAEALLANTEGTDEDEAQLHFAPHGVRHLRHFRQEKLSAIESEGSTASSERRSSTLISL
mmetsp:Transcript_62041/g.101468  ORF Transcript_62041/g.101468 Transcript_62041/m.101468 type:complete len:682 (-) Transcript_62041:67-2112(-)